MQKFERLYRIPNPFLHCSEAKDIALAMQVGTVEMPLNYNMVRFVGNKKGLD